MNPHHPAKSRQQWLLHQSLSRASVPMRVTNAEPQSTKPVDESVGADEAEHVVDPPAAQPKSTDDVIVESGSLQNDHQSQSQDPPTSGSVSCIQLF